MIQHVQWYADSKIWLDSRSVMVESASRYQYSPFMMRIFTIRQILRVLTNAFPYLRLATFV